MIIPRYQGGLSNQPINTGRSLGTGIAGAETLTNLSGVANNVSQKYGALAIELAAKQRDQEINNQTIKSRADNSNAQADTLLDFNNRSDYKNFITDYDKHIIKQENILRKNYTDKQGNFDEIAYKRFLPFFYADNVEGKIKTNKIINEKTQKDNLNSFFIDVDLNNSKLKSTDNIFELNSNYIEFGLSYDNSAKLNGIDPKIIADNRSNSEKIATTSRIKIDAKNAAGESLYRTRNDGTKVLNANALYNQLNNKDYVIKDINGNTLLKNDPLVKNILENLKLQSTNNKNIEDRNLELLIKEERNIIEQMLFNNKDPDKIMEYIRESKILLTQPSIALEYKEILDRKINGLNTLSIDEAKDIKLKSLKTLEAIMRTNLLSIEESYKVINKLNILGYYDELEERNLYKDHIKLLEDRKKNKDTHIQKKLDSAKKTISSMMNKEILDQIIGNLKKGETVDQNALFNALGSNESEAIYVMSRNFDKIVEDYENKNGNPLDLLDPTNENYIVNDFIDIYQLDRIPEFGIPVLDDNGEVVFANKEKSIPLYANYTLVAEVKKGDVVTRKAGYQLNEIDNEYLLINRDSLGYNDTNLDFIPNKFRLKLDKGMDLFAEEPTVNYKKEVDETQNEYIDRIYRESQKGLN